MKYAYTVIIGTINVSIPPLKDLDYQHILYNTYMDIYGTVNILIFTFFLSLIAAWRP